MTDSTLALSTWRRALVVVVFALIALGGCDDSTDAESETDAGGDVDGGSETKDSEDSESETDLDSSGDAREDSAPDGADADETSDDVDGARDATDGDTDSDTGVDSDAVSLDDSASDAEALDDGSSDTNSDTASDGQSDAIDSCAMTCGIHETCSDDGEVCVCDLGAIDLGDGCEAVDVGNESYAPAAGQPGTTAIATSDERIVGWSTGHSDVSYGEAVDERWRNPENAHGPAGAGSFGVVVLGRGGSITMTFDTPIRDGDGPDFAVFENGLSDTFLELGYAEVSSDGVTFERFDVLYAGTSPVGGFGAMDTTEFTGFAGKYRAGFGTPFDLGLLKKRDAVRAGVVDLSAITHVRIVDVIGAGGADGYEAELDALGRIIYDLYPTVGSAGFDLAGIAVLNERED